MPRHGNTASFDRPTVDLGLRKCDGMRRFGEDSTRMGGMVVFLFLGRELVRGGGGGYGETENAAGVFLAHLF